MSLRLAALLLVATSALAELRLGPEVAIGEVGREIKHALNSRPAIATDGTNTLLVWTSRVLNQGSVLVASRLGTGEPFRLAEDAAGFGNDVFAFPIGDAYVVLYGAGRDELRALRIDDDGAIETVTIQRAVRSFSAASNGTDILVAADTGNSNVAVLVRGDLSEVRELGKLGEGLVAVAGDAAGFGILTATEATLWVRFFDGKELTERQELLRSGGTFPAIAFAASGGTFVAAWQQCVDDTCAVRGARFTRDKFVGALQFDAPRKRAKSRELGLAAFSPDSLIVWWGESDEYERLQSVLARRVVGEETLDPQPIVVANHSVGMLAANGHLVIADAVVRAATVENPLAKTWPQPEMKPHSIGTTFERADGIGAAGDRLVLVRHRLHKLPPYGSTAATVLERGRARELAMAPSLYGISTASDGRHVAVAGFDGRLNLIFQREGQEPRVVLAGQQWEDTTAMVWTGDRYLIAWTAWRHLRLLEVDRDGKPLGEPRDAAKLITKEEEPTQRDPAFARGANGEILLVWSEGDAWHTGDRFIRAMRIGRDEEPTVLSENGQHPSAAWNGRAFAVAWGAPGENPSLRGAILRGTTITPFAVPGSAYAYEPDLVAIDGTFVLACRDYDERPLARIAQFDGNGKLLANITTPSGGEHFMRPHLAIAGKGRLALFHARYVPDEPYHGTFRTFVRFIDVE